MTMKWNQAKYLLLAGICLGLTAESCGMKRSQGPSRSLR